MASPSKPISTSSIQIDNPLTHRSAHNWDDRQKIEAVFRMKSIEIQYVNTYKALHLGEGSAESRMIRSAAVAAYSFPTHNESEMSQRLSKYDRIKPILNRLTDDQLSRLLASAKLLGKSAAGKIHLANGRGDNFCEKNPSFRP